MPERPTRLSAVLAVRDEERMLDPCLRLLGFADEIVVVVDARTRDRTEEIARRHTEHVHVREFDTFSAQKNFALEQARGAWLLVVDADERITPALAREIEATLAREPSEWAFEIETINHFLGGRVEHGGWKEWHVRLIRAEHARYHNDIHEAFAIPPERLGRLEEGMWHFSHRSIQEMLAKTVRFGEVQARELLAAGAPRVTGRRLAAVILRELANRFGRGAHRDGMPGIIEGLYQPFSLFCVHVMLWQLQRRETLDETYSALDAASARHR